MARTYFLNPFRDYTYNPESPPNSTGANTGQPGQWCARLAFAIGRVVGKNWWEAPDTNLSDAKAHMDLQGTAHGGFVQRVQIQGTDQAIAPTVNFRGSGAAGSYDAAANKINVDISGGSGGSGGVDHNLLSTTHLDTQASDTPVNGDAMLRSGGAWLADKITEANVHPDNVNGADNKPALRELGTTAGKAAPGTSVHPKTHALLSEDHADVMVTDPNHGDVLGWDEPSQRAMFVPNPAASVYVSPALLEGLNLVWQGSNTLLVESGAAYVPGLNKVLQLSGDFQRPVSFGAFVNSLAFIYLYESAPGTAGIEMSTTPPVRYHGRARHMTNDPSRRYLGAVLANGEQNAGMYRFHQHQNGFVSWLENIMVYPFRVLPDGQATTETSVSCSNCVPPSSRLAQLYMTHESYSFSIGSQDDNLALATTTGDVPPVSLYWQDTDYDGNRKFATPLVHLDALQRFTYRAQGPPGANNGPFIAVAGYFEER